MLTRFCCFGQIDSALSILWRKRDRRADQVFQNLSFTHQGMSLQAIFNCYCKGLRVCLDVLSHFYVSFVAIPFLSCHCFMAISLVGIRKTGSGEGTLLPIFSWGRGDVCTQAYFSGADGKKPQYLINFTVHSSLSWNCWLLQIHSRPISRPEWKNFGSEGKWRENWNSQRKNYISPAV